VKVQRIRGTLLIILILVSFSFSAEILARVNGQEILLEDFQQIIESVSMNSNEQIPGNTQTKMSILEDMIKNILVAQQAKEMGIQVSTKDVKQTIRILERSFPSKADFKEALIQEGVYSEEGLHRGIRQQMLIDSIQEKLIEDLEISEDEIDAYIDQNRNQFNFSRKFQLHQMIVPTEDMAVQIYENILSGEDFARLAKMYSIDSETSQQGGLIGYIEEDLLQPEILYALNEVSVNEVVGPLKIEDEYYLVKYSSIIEPQQIELKDIKKKVSNFLIESKRETIFNQWFDEIRDEARVKINRKYHDYLKEKI
jgi:foldase protein PrsA